MERKWWHDKIAYQIYPKSFCDSNGDGIGDLPGIISKLDYLKELGIDIIWICPIYESPFVDQGYDISDYYKIAECFGTMEDFDNLLEETKRRGMYVLMDLVANHCSDRHPWFQAMLRDPEGPYRNYFYVQKGRNGHAPSNLRARFGGSAWEQIPGTDSYYLHTFAKEQPDLNWENEEVRHKLYEMVKFWLKKGLAGFRIDAITNIKKNLILEDLPADGEDGLHDVTIMTEHVTGFGDLLQELKKETFDLYDAFTVGEVHRFPEGTLADFVGENGHFSTMFDFAYCVSRYGVRGWADEKPWDLVSWREVTAQRQKEMEDIGLLANVLENHDWARAASSYLPSYAQNEMGIKMMATVSLLLRGIPFIYQGQEIGMTNCPFPSMDDFDDLGTKDQYQTLQRQGYSANDALELCRKFSRDNTRTPMQWSDAPQAGFTTGTPWLMVNPNYTDINVAKQQNRADSVLSYYKQLIALRKAEPYKETFVYGRFELLYEDVSQVFAYVRKHKNQELLVIANYGEESVKLEVHHKCSSFNKVLLSNWSGAQEGAWLEQLKSGVIKLPSCGCVVISEDQ